MKFIIYAILTQRESRKFEKSICHFLTNRTGPFFLLANKRARRIMNFRLNKFSRAFLSRVLI